MGRKICKILISLFLLMTMLCQNFVKADEQQSTEQWEIADNTNGTIEENMQQEQQLEKNEKNNWRKCKSNCSSGRKYIRKR